KDTGSIVGTVKDQTGALVANAKVTVTDVERGPALTTTTNDAGEYVAGPLRVGRYTVMVQHPGFKQAVSVPVNLDVQQRIAINVTNYVIQPSVEALEEFKVQTNAYSAEFGRGNGAIINATIKSGTNQFHGSVYEFLRNEKFDGKNFFDDPTLPIAPYKQNQFG